MSNRTLIIILAVVAAFVGWFLFLRPRRTVAINGVVTPPARVLPPIPPPTGSMGSGSGTSSGFASTYGMAAGAAVTAACVANGGGPLCGVAGSIAQKAGTLYATGAQKVATTVYSGAKTAVTSTVSLLGKLNPF